MFISNWFSDQASFLPSNICYLFIPHYSILISSSSCDTYICFWVICITYANLYFRVSSLINFQFNTCSNLDPRLVNFPDVTKKKTSMLLQCLLITYILPFLSMHQNNYPRFLMSLNDWNCFFFWKENDWNCWNSVFFYENIVLLYTIH